MSYEALEPCAVTKISRDDRFLLTLQLNIVSKSQISPFPAHNHKGCAGRGANFVARLPRKIRLPPSRERGFIYPCLGAESIEIPKPSASTKTRTYGQKRLKMHVITGVWRFVRGLPCLQLVKLIDTRSPHETQGNRIPQMGDATIVLSVQN
jgi:hypothetical protein